MPVMFNSVLRDAGLDPAKVTLVRHQDTRAAKGRSPFELWREGSGIFEDYLSHQDTYNRSKFCRVQKWATFVGTPAGKTLFVGLYHATLKGTLKKDRPKPHMDGMDKAGTCDVYEVRREPQLADLIGKLVINWGDGPRAWVQRADSDTGKRKVVTELHNKFEEEPFPGFMHFMAPLSQLEALPIAWAEVLKSNKGIYLLSCPKTYEQYVGSATGEHGFWQRFVEYARTGHGGNVVLKRRDRSDYQVSILEVAGSEAGDAQIAKMESLWKKKLQTREMGLNGN
jgi:hypothetical protein